MDPESTDAAEKLLDEIRDLRKSAWSKAAPPTSDEHAYQLLMLDRMRALSVELITRQGVTTAILEGAYLIWWLRIACMNHRFAEGGFERSIGRIGPLMGPVSDIMV